MTTNLSTLKRRENAAARLRVNETDADDGPHLEGNLIVIPSPAPHPKFKRILLAYGFEFQAGYPPVWTRSTIKPHRGIQYSDAGWLTWATQHYQKAWPSWGKTDD